MGRPSIALAQAFQFELMLRQKDVIGEWVPIREPGISDVQADGLKWLRGIRWEEIDQNMVLRHLTSKRQKMIEVSLRNAPMVIEEMALLGAQPANGPIIVSEWDRLPWTGPEFRRWWRIVAEAAGVPKEVRNMDSRAGAISEATDAGADLEHVRHAATHSNISMTQRYSRGAEGKIENVQKLRAEHRKNRVTDRD
jgi:site-specific recombinase XerD